MTKYVYANLVELLKQDAKIIKKFCKNKNIHLSEIQTELAKFFGYRHFHELETFHSKNNIFTYEENHLNKLTKNEFEELKEKYNKVFISFSDHIKYNKNIFDKIKPLWSTLIYRDSKETIQYNMVKSNYKFVFNNELFEELMNIYASENSYSDSYLEFHVTNFNNLIFDILRFVKSDNYSRDYRNYIGFVSFSNFLEKNTNFKSTYLDNYNMLMKHSSNEIKREQHGYMSMVFSEFCNHLFISNESNNNEAIIVEDLINNSFNHQFHYYEGLPQLTSRIFKYVDILVKKHYFARINKLSNENKIKLFSRKREGIIISRKLDYDLIREYLSAIDFSNKIKCPSVWFIDNNKDKVKDIIFEQKFNSTRSCLNHGSFVVQYHRIILSNPDIIIINSEFEGFESRYVKEAIDSGHIVFLIDTKNKFNESILSYRYDNIMKLN